MMKENILLQYWDTWQGNVQCSYSKTLFTAEELRGLTDRVADDFKLSGIKSGAIVAMMLNNTVAFPICLMALLQLQANPLLLHAKTTENELNKLSENISISWMIKDHMGAEINLKPAKNNILIKNIELVIYKGSIELNTLYKTGVVLHQTSGTFGKPLICIRDQRVAVAEGINYVSSINSYENIKIRLTTPLHHAFAYGFGLIASIITNSTIIIDPMFNPKKVLKEESKNLSDILCVVPPMLQSLIYFKQIDSSLRLPRDVYYAGTKCDPSLIDKFETTFASRLFAILGSTETGAIACNHVNHTKANGVGKLLNNVEILIKNQAKYKDLGDDIGELFIKSTSMMQRYYHEADDKKINYFSTGDLVKLDGNHDLHIIGRIKDIINVAGVKVDPTEVENVLLEYQGVADAVVYPGRSKNGEEIVLAAISTKADLDESGIIEFCANRLNHYKIPEKINFLSDIPRTPSGKCQKMKLPGYINNEVFS